MNREDYNFDPMTGEKVIKDDYNFDPMTGEKIIKDDYNFDPMTGEKVVKTNEQSQQFNSEGYQPNNKIAVIVIVVVTVIFLANPILTSEAIKWSAVKLNDGEIPNTYENNMPSVEIKGVGTKSSIINKLRENTDKSLGSLQVSEIDGGVKYYTLEDQILRIDIPSGVNGFKYNRIYYFNNDVLYFGLVYSAANQNSLYFYQGEMYRYINEKGEMKQNEFKDDVFKTLGNFALNEAYSFYDYKTGVKNDRR